MHRSTDRIATTHTGSLPRPKDLSALYQARAQGEEVDPAALGARIDDAVVEIVDRQLAAGIDIVDDGEVGKISYSTYVRDRLSGFDGESKFTFVPKDLVDYPGFGQRSMQDPSMALLQVPACTGPVAHGHLGPVRADVDRLRRALDGKEVEGAFLNAVAPGVIPMYFEDQHYGDHERYVYALAEAMRPEYEAIVEGGFDLQVDCPDLGVGWHSMFAEQSLDEFRRTVAMHVDALNGALANIDPERVRMHVCWGNYEGPHDSDVALADTIDLLYEARPATLVLEACNPRHAHEWQVLRDHPLPDGKVLAVGVIDTTTNYVEHPDLVAERLTRYADVVGRERVLACTDCGFATVAGQAVVHPKVAWAKLRTLVEGASRASAQLWVTPTGRGVNA
jgi:5-methyltetrahydropteroyltriglutamate--homocysteine methyltransferase